jgi:hypothetical protein
MVAQCALPKLKIGQIVSYQPAASGVDAPQGLYVVIARLRQGDDGQFEYRIKHSHEPHRRIAKQSELSSNGTR